MWGGRWRISSLNQWLGVIVELYEIDSGKAPIPPLTDTESEREQALANAARVERAFRRAGGYRILEMT